MKRYHTKIDVRKYSTISELSSAFLLNRRQRYAFQVMATSFLERIQSGYTKNDPKQPLRLFVGSEGGTGKSRVIQAIIAMSHAWDQPDSIKAVAPIGVAAIQINGVMVLSFFKSRKNGGRNILITDRDRGRFPKVKMI